MAIKIDKTKYKEDRATTWNSMSDIIEKADDEKRSLTKAEAEEYDRLSRNLTALDKIINGSATGSYDPLADMHGRAVALDGDKRNGYTAEVEGREHEVLRPDQSMAEWYAKRNSKTAHDVDWDAYWGQRMGLRAPGAELRALGEDTSSGGGAGQAVVPQEWSTSFVDLLRPQLVITRAGASLMPMETELYNLPTYVSDVSPSWLAENSSVSLDANPQFSTVQFNAKGAFTDITLFSRQMAEDTNQSGGLAGLLTDTIAQKYARVIDQAAIYGVSGNAGNPGLNAESGLVSQSMGTNGAAPTDTQFISTAVESVRKANVEPSALISNPQVYGTVNRLNASTYAKYWERTADTANVPWLYSTALSATETQGTSSVASSLYAGDWSRMVIGMRVDLDVKVLNERYADVNQIGLLSYMRFSIRTTHPEAFTRVVGILTT